jgi:3-oxoacyl-[acyl-carrier-protein] synthase I
MPALNLSRFTCSSCLGLGLEPTLSALRHQRGGLAPCRFETVTDLETYLGEVPGVDDAPLPSHMSAFECRNNRLAFLSLHQDGFSVAIEAAMTRYGRRRLGILLGTSTAGILQTEQAYRRLNPSTGALPDDFNYPNTHNLYSLANFLRHWFRLEGPAAVISTACSSSAKVFASAARMIAAGVIDAALVGGVDSLCLTTLYGFNSLGLLATQPCRPFDSDRKGISIGEAAAFALLERPGTSLDANEVLLLGFGESSDAYHMSTPRPDGLGARLAMTTALRLAGLPVGKIDYINLHGTGTPSNDASEGKAILALFGSGVPCSSTKGATGHTLGAAGGLEAIISALALQHGFLPGGINSLHPDPAIPIRYLTTNSSLAPRRVMSNSFGFGGTNCSLVLGLAG